MSHLPIIDPEFKSLIPPLTLEEQEQLEQNILESRKCYDPIILWEGIIIDGHNRFEICAKHGIEFQIKGLPLISREAARIWILENQLSRRNLTDAARIEVALLKAEMLREKAHKNLSRAGEKGKPFTKSSKPGIKSVNVEKTIAAEADVGAGTLQRYMQIKDHGSPELLGKVHSGELKIGTAHRLLEKEILKQLNQANKMIKFITHAIPDTGCEDTNPNAHTKLLNVTKVLSQLLETLGGDHEAA